MGIYLNEFNSKLRGLPAHQVAADPHKIRFNNIQSCIGLVVHDTINNRMVGVHLTIMHTQEPGEMDEVIQRIKNFTGPNKNNVYLVYSARHYVGYSFTKALKTVASHIYACKIQTEERQGADVDVNVKLIGGKIRIWMRRHAAIKSVVTPTGNQSVVKAKYIGDDAAVKEAHARGKHIYETEKEGKDWMEVPAFEV